MIDPISDRDRIEAEDKPTPPINLRNLIREPWETYDANRANYLTSHALARFRWCPRAYRRMHLGLIADKDSAAYTIGRAAHTLILEGREQYDRQFAVGGPVNTKTGKPYGSQTKAYAAWVEQVRTSGRQALSVSQAATVESMALAVGSHAIAKSLLAEGMAERVARCDIEGIPCQARFDWIHPEDGLVDLKTCDSLDGFEQAARVFGYIHQMAFYLDVLERATGWFPPMIYIIAAEKREPYRVGVWAVCGTAIDRATKENMDAIEEMTKAHETGDWLTRYEELRSLEL